MPHFKFVLSETSLLPLADGPYWIVPWDLNRLATNNAIPTRAQDPITIRVTFVGLLLAVERFTESSFSLRSPAADTVSLVAFDAAVGDDDTERLTGGAMIVGEFMTGAKVGAAGVGASSGNLVARLMDKLNGRYSLSNKSRNLLTVKQIHMWSVSGFFFSPAKLAVRMFLDLPMQLLILKDGRKMGHFFRCGASLGIGNAQ
jgi:hypothetical protein